MDWITAVVGLVGVVLGAGIQEYRRWREGKERYQVMTFEKRLQAHQEAIAWCTEIAFTMTPSKLSGEQGRQQLLDYVDEAQEWLSNNSLLLDLNSRQSILKGFDLAGDKVLQYTDGMKTIDEDKELSEVSEMFTKAVKCISQGVGVKYMPDIKERLKP